MNNIELIVKDFLAQLGYSKDEISIYLSLVENGPSTLLKVSKNSSIERTKLYRIIDSLIQKGIVEEIPAYKRKTIKAADLNTIDFLVRKKQAEAFSLRENFLNFSDAITNLSKNSDSKVNVTYYRGVEGMKQMIWHLTNCDGFYRTYSYRFWNDIIGDKFTLELNKIMLEKKFKVHDLYSDQYFEYKKKWMETRGKKPSGDWSFWNARFISEKIVTINQNVDIYNDIVAYSYWDDEDIFGVEIQNKRIADMQKQIHDCLWKLGKKVDDLDWANPVWKKSSKK